MEVYRLHTLEVHNGPLSSILKIKSKFMAKSEDSIRLFGDCEEDDGDLQCSGLSNEIIGNEVQCVENIFKKKGVSNTCQSESHRLLIRNIFTSYPRTKST